MKKHVIDYWEKILQAEANPLPSLNYFKPSFMSLTSIHPIWSTAGYSSSKVAMATIQARMLSGRYRTEYLCRHWSKNKAGICLLSEACSSTLDQLPHILAVCPALQPTRDKLVKFTMSYCQRVPYLSHIIFKYLRPDHPLYCHFIIDCSTIPQIISATQEYGNEALAHFFNITRTWCYSLHRERMKILGRWNIM